MEKKIVKHITSDQYLTSEHVWTTSNQKGSEDVIFKKL